MNIRNWIVDVSGLAFMSLDFVKVFG